MTVLESRIKLGREQLLWMYERMGLIREFEERLKVLVERGLPVGATHYYVGEEAVAVGVCAAPQADRLDRFDAGDRHAHFRDGVRWRWSRRGHDRAAPDRGPDVCRPDRLLL